MIGLLDHLIIKALIGQLVQLFLPREMINNGMPRYFPINRVSRSPHQDFYHFKIINYVMEVSYFESEKTR